MPHFDTPARRIILAGGFALLILGAMSWGRSNAQASWLEESVARHSSNLPPEVDARAHGEDELHRFFAQNLRYNVLLPRFQRTDFPVRLVGVRTLPSQGLVVTLVLSFVVVVGPLNYLLLRRRDKQLLLVLTVPALSALWTALILTTGYVTKGRSTVARRLTLLEVELGARAARPVPAREVGRWARCVDCPIELGRELPLRVDCGAPFPPTGDERRRPEGYPIPHHGPRPLGRQGL